MKHVINKIKFTYIKQLGSPKFVSWFIAFFLWKEPWRYSSGVILRYTVLDWVRAACKGVVYSQPPLWTLLFCRYGVESGSLY